MIVMQVIYMLVTLFAVIYGSILLIDYGYFHDSLSCASGYVSRAYEFVISSRLLTDKHR